MATLSLDEARLSWSARQRLGAGDSLDSVPGGWSRSLGGVDPYLAMRARVPGLTRAVFDQAIAEDRIRVVPGVRGCIWLVPAADVPLALVVSEAQAKRTLVRNLGKLGRSEDDLRTLGERILETLANAPATPDQLRSKLPEGSIAAFGAPGKKLGVTTDLPPALRLLEWDGAIRRRHTTGRVDCNGYTWEIPDTSPLSLGEIPGDDQAQVTALAARFFEWAAPATLTEFVNWAKVAKGKAKKAIAALGLEENELCGEVVYGSLQSTDDDALHFVPGQDNLLSLRAHPGRLAGDEHQEMQVFAMGPGLVPLTQARWMFHRVIAQRGRIVGFWEWDRDAQDTVQVEIEDVGASLQGLAAFIRDDLGGEAKGNAIDGPSRQKKRVDWVNALR